jgi:hypothetical protein
VEHAKDKRFIAPFVFVLAVISGTYLLIGVEQGNRNGAIVAAILTAILVAVGIFEFKRPVRLDDEEKRRMGLKPPE